MGIGGRTPFSDLGHIMPFPVLGILIVNPIAAGPVHLVPAQCGLVLPFPGLRDLRLSGQGFPALSRRIRAKGFLPVHITIAPYIISIGLSGSPPCMHIGSSVAICNLRHIFPGRTRFLIIQTITVRAFQSVPADFQRVVSPALHFIDLGPGGLCLSGFSGRIRPKQFLPVIQAMISPQIICVLFPALQSRMYIGRLKAA